MGMFFITFKMCERKADKAAQIKYNKTERF
jgi:hypothetical protein